MKDSIISLCYVSKRSSTTVEMCRIADLHDGRFEPYHYDNTVDFYDVERDLIYGSTNKLYGEVTSINVYEWSAYQDDRNQWKTETVNSDISWTEVVMTRCATPEDIIRALRAGWKAPAYYDGRHDMIICCTRNDSTNQAILCPAGVLLADGETVTIANDVISLDVGTVNAQYASASCKCRYSSYDSRKYLVYREAWQKTGTIRVKSNEEVIGSIVSAQIGRLEQDALTKKEKQAARKALNKLSTSSIEQGIREKLGCSEEEARSYVDEYLTKRSGQLDDDRITSLVATLVDSDSQAVEALREKIEKEWNDKHEQRIASAQREIKEANDALSSIQHHQREAKQELIDITAQKEEASKQIEELRGFQSDVETEIQRRLEEAGNKRTEALVSDAFVRSMLNRLASQFNISGLNASGPRQSEANTGYHIAKPQIGSEISEGKIDDNFADAVDSLDDYCTTLMGASNLAAFLFTGFACKQHFVFTGETSELLVKAYSASITGEECPVLTVAENTDADAIVNDLLSIPHEIVAVRTISHAGYDTVRQVMRTMSDTQFVLLLDHEESLAMEPSGFFTTFMPVLTDLFCRASEIDITGKFSCSKALLKVKALSTSKTDRYKAAAACRKWFEHAPVSPLLEARCTKMMEVLSKLGPLVGRTSEETEKTGSLFLFIPLLTCLRSKSTIAERLNNETVIAADKDQLLHLLGIEDD